jgi:orotidine-5'-phosphate decarboxylase
MSLAILKTRQDQVRHPLAKKLLDLAVRKRSNLCLSLDVTKSADFLKIADMLGPYIVMLKTHIDILDDFRPELIEQLQQLAQKHEFFIFEDRKFADIGNTAKLQYAQGIYHIATWADFITTHALPGEGMLTALKEVGLPLGHASLMLVQMSCEGNLLNATYQQEAIRMGQQHPDFVAGFIAQQRFADTDAFLCCTPGISLVAKNDTTGQQYKTPAEAITQGADILIVGRGLYQAQDPVAEVQKYLAPMV